MVGLKFAALAGLGIICALALLPSTGWIVRNHVDAIVGQSPGRAYDGCLQPSGHMADDADSQLAVALANSASTGKSGPHLDALASYCHAHPNDVRGWAFLLRRANSMPLHASGEPVRGPISPEAAAFRGKTTTLMLEAAKNGMRLEPDNLFFPFLDMVALYSLDRVEEARSVLRAASTKSNYEDHTSDEVNLLYAAATRKCGYRGNVMKATILAGVLYPELANLNHLLPAICQGSPELRLDMIRAAHTAAAKADTPILVFVMKSVFTRAVMDTNERKKVDPAELAAAASLLGRATHSSDAELFLADFSGVGMRPNPDWDRENSVFQAGTAQSIAGTMLLIGLLLAFPGALAAAGLCVAKRSLSDFVRNAAAAHRRWAALALVLLVGLFVLGLCLMSVGPADDAIVIALVMVLAAPVAIWLAIGVKSGEATRTDGQKGSSGRWLLSNGLAWLGLTALAGASLQEFGRHPGAEWAIMGSTLMPAVGNLMWVVGIAASLAALFVVPRRAGNLVILPAFLFALLPLGYLVSVVGTVRLDSEMGQLVQGFSREADEVRGPWSSR